MTLRVTIEIVPFGVEEDKRTIGVANISNIGGDESGLCHYEYNYTCDIGKAEGIIYNHRRKDGPMELVNRVTTSILNQL